MSFDLSTISGAALGRLYRNGDITPSDATDWFLHRIAKSDDPAIFICMTTERARREAAESTKRYRSGSSLGPLDGVPVAWKDLFDVEGTVTTAGSDIYRYAPLAKEDARCAKLAAEAGLVAVGKVNLSEFAYSGLGLNPHYGTPRNPRGANEHRAPGGSSSGSAVAVAAGLVPCAIGTDTGGSVRIPAAFNGIVGLKTALGRIDKRGVFPLSNTLDTVGPLARTVEDCVLLECALRGVVQTQIQPAALTGLRFVAPTNVVRDEVEDAVMMNFVSVLDALRRHSASVMEKQLDSLDELQAVLAKHGTISAAEAYEFHKPLVTSPDRDRIDPRVLTRILRGATMSIEDLHALQGARIRLRDKIARELDGRLLLMPTVPHVAPRVAALEHDTELFHTVNLKTIRNTTVGSMLDLPGIALPSGTDAQGRPTSVLVSAPAGSEEVLYAASAAVEALMFKRAL